MRPSATAAPTVIVTAGVSDGERVVTDGQYKLQRGATVSIATGQSAAAGEAR